MAQNKWLLAATYAKKESSFGTDPSASGSAMTFIKTLIDASFEPMYDVIERDGLTSDLVRLPHVIGAKRGKLTFKTEVKGSGTAAASAVAAIAGESDEMLQCAFGTVTRGTGTTVTGAGSTTTTVDCVSAAALSKYMMVIINCGATYGYVPRFITSIASNTITLDHALPAIPAAAAVVQATNKYTRANSGHGSMTFTCLRDGVQYTFVGCKLDSLKISPIAGRDTAIFEWAWEATDFSVTAKGSLPSSSLTGITAVKAPVVKGSPYAVGATEEFMYQAEIDFGLKFSFVDSTAGLGSANPDSVNSGLELTDSNPGGSVKSYYLAQHMTDFAAGNQIALMFATLGSTGNAWGFYAPACQYLQPSFDNHQGMVGQTLPFKINDNSTDPEYSFCLA